MAAKPKLTDKRLGMRDKEGVIIASPSYYATGETWNRQSFPTPTTVYFGINNSFYYVLPPRVTTVPQSTKNEFFEHVAPLEKSMFGKTTLNRQKDSVKQVAFPETPVFDDVSLTEEHQPEGEAEETTEQGD